MNDANFKLNDVRQPLLFAFVTGGIKDWLEHSTFKKGRVRHTERDKPGELYGHCFHASVQTVAAIDCAFRRIVIGDSGTVTIIPIKIALPA